MSFNVNGIRARQAQLEAVIVKHQPAVMGLQETKVEDASFPHQWLSNLGYQVVFHGQKGHYGVALLYKGDAIKTRVGFPEDGEDTQRRFVGVSLNVSGQILHIYNGYFPQGENRNHPSKFKNKEHFYRDLTSYISSTHAPTDWVVVMGDMNVAPFDKDIGIGEPNRKRWLRDGKCCFLPEEREWFNELTSWGLVDTLEWKKPNLEEERYSWFDYRSGGFDKSPKRGLRIDLILASTPLLNKLENAGVDQDARGMAKPSDHCPVWADFSV